MVFIFKSLIIIPSIRGESCCWPCFFMTTTCMLRKISSVTLNWSQRPWIHISPITIKHCLFAQAPIWRAVGGFVVGSDKERCESIVWTSGQTLQSLDSLFLLPPPPLCVLLTLLKPKLNDSDSGVHENPPCLRVSPNVSRPPPVEVLWW